MDIELTLALILMFTGFIAGFIDAIAGGGGLITVPVLLAAGLSPVEAIATNKLQASFGTFSATRYFVRKKIVDLSTMKVAIIWTFIGAASGALIVQTIDPSFLAKLMPILLIMIAAYFLFAPNLDETQKPERLKPTLFGMLIGGSIGFYDGFFGPGTGTFFTVAYVLLAGHGLLQATAHTKVLNFTSNIASLLFFAIGGHIMWFAGAIMAVGQIIGGQLGARMAVNKGHKLIKPLIVGITVALSAKLLSQAFF